LRAPRSFYLVVADLNDFEVLIVLVPEIFVASVVVHSGEQFGIFIGPEVSVGHQFVIPSVAQHATDATELVIAQLLLIFSNMIASQRQRFVHLLVDRDSGTLLPTLVALRLGCFCLLFLTVRVFQQRLDLVRQQLTPGASRQIGEF